MIKPLLRTLLIKLFLIFSFWFCQAQHPDFGRRKFNFDFDWNFHLGDFADAKNVNFDTANWRQLNLPHDWSIEGKVEKNNPSGNDGGYFPTGIGWYRKRFFVPKSQGGKKTTIYFEGVYMNAEVFINGKSLGVRPYGYSSFAFDLTPHLRYGSANVIAVRVDNSKQKNSRWYTGSGIYRHVWLLTSNHVHVKHWGIKFSTKQLLNGKAQTMVQTTVVNETAMTKQIWLTTSLVDRSGKSAGVSSKMITITPNSSREFLQEITVKNPLLWHVSRPNLYQLNVELKEGQNLIDVQHLQVGLRTIKFSVNEGFTLNGQTVKLNGGCVHHDNGALGAAAYDRAEVRKAELLKAAGFNSVRTAHNPPSEAFLDACDRVGLLVIDEAFDGWRTKKTDHDYAKEFDEWSERDLSSLVSRDFNHPSIIMWSIGNEIIERKEVQAVKTAERLANIVRRLDTTRAVTSAMTTWDSAWNIFDPLFAAHDVGGYNYQLHRAVTDHQRVPSRIIVQTESYPNDAFANWKLVKYNDYIIGDYVWTAMDYLGESGIGRYFYQGEVEGEHYQRDIYPWHGAYSGDIDLTGWRKPISHYRDLLYNNDKKLYLAVKEPDNYYGKIKTTLWAVWPTWESWTWPGHEEKNIEVEVYSRYPKVRLYLNEKLIAEKPTTENEQFKAVFTIPYQAGKLKAVGVIGAREVESKQLVTAGEAYAIRLKPDRTQIDASGQDLSFVTIEVLDKNGNIQPNATNRLKFEISGEGTIVGVDNADLKDTDLYTATERNVWKGRALVIIKSSRKNGTIRLKVSSPVLKEAELKIKSESM